MPPIASAPFRALLSPPAFSPLSLPGLVAYWRLDEASGTRVDATGRGNDLTDNNTVTQAVGRVGNAAQFTAANSEYLSRADNADLSTGDIDWTFWCWARLASKGAERAMGGKYLSAGEQREWLLEFNNTADRFQLFVSSTGTAASRTILSATSLGSPSTATWYFLVGWHDSVANTINIQANNGTVDSAAHAGGLINGTGAFTLGSQDGGIIPWDGLIDEAGFCKRVLTAAERTNVYHYGGGV